MPRLPAAPPTPEVEPRPPVQVDLTINKIIAGAGAAATAAVLGSYLGAGGTVAGAAIGSVASTVATTLYQRSLDRTRDTVSARIRRGRDRSVDPEITIPMQRDAEPGTVVLSPAQPPPRRRPRRVVIATVVVFALALLAVTGLEWAKGSTLTQSESGTSVGRVIAPGPSTDRPATEEPTAEPSTTEPATEPPASSDSSEAEVTPEVTDTPEVADPGADISDDPAATDTDPTSTAP